jgi:hypothetical protein
MAEDRLRKLLDEANPERKSRIVSVRLRPSEYATLERLARDGRTGPATLARYLILLGFSLDGIEGVLKRAAREGGRK